MEKQNWLMWHTEGVGDLGKKKKKSPLQSALYIVKVGKFLLTVCPPFFFFFFFLCGENSIYKLFPFKNFRFRRTLAKWKILFHMSHKSNIQLNKVRIGYQIHQNVYIWQTLDTCVSTLKAPVYKSIEPKLVPH